MECKNCAHFLVCRYKQSLEDLKNLMNSYGEVFDCTVTCMFAEEAGE